VVLVLLAAARQQPHVLRRPDKLPQLQLLDSTLMTKMTRTLGQQQIRVGAVWVVAGVALVEVAGLLMLA
jgi:hypothetical protein